MAENDFKHDYVDAGYRATHDHIDEGDRATQEAKAENAQIRAGSAFSNGLLAIITHGRFERYIMIRSSITIF